MSQNTFAKLTEVRRKRPLIAVYLRSRTSTFPGILEVAEQMGWQVRDLTLSRGQLTSSMSLAGAIVDLLPEHPLMKKLQELGCPSVRVGYLPIPGENTPAVVPDLTVTGRMAAEHFVKRGFRHFGYIGSNPWADMKLLQDTFRTCASEFGCSFHLLRLEGHSDEAINNRVSWYDDLTQQTASWLHRIPKPAGLLLPTDKRAATVSQICLDHELAIPEQVGLLARGNHEIICGTASVPLSSIDPNNAEAGRQAALQLKRLMEGEPAPAEPIFIPPLGVVTRQSSDVLASGDPTVARAMRYMWDHLDWPLTVDDVALAAGVNRRSLERAFRQHLGRGIKEELNRRRLERLQQLLLITDRTVEELAHEVGFQSAEYLSRRFRAVFGTSPSRYRERRRSPHSAAAL